jgi:hypothetical protein
VLKNSFFIAGKKENKKTSVQIRQSEEMAGIPEFCTGID